MIEDDQLLRQYSQDKSEDAFAELVRRHIDLVYSAALRVLSGDIHQAEDVTQIVFKELAAKARWFSSDVVLAGWLYRTASFTAAKVVRSERRRKSREQTATEMTTTDIEPAWEQIAPCLDDALNQLASSDRDAIVLRFLKRQDFRTIGTALSISEDAAQKRVARSLEKLRAILDPAHRGLALGALGSLLTAQAVSAAPPGLVTSVIALSASAGVAATGTGLTIMKLMTMTKLQAGVAGVVLLGAVATPFVAQHQSLDRLRDENDALKLQVAQAATELRQSAQAAALATADQGNSLNCARITPSFCPCATRCGNSASTWPC